MREDTTYYALYVPEIQDVLDEPEWNTLNDIIFKFDKEKGQFIQHRDPDIYMRPNELYENDDWILLESWDGGKIAGRNMSMVSDKKEMLQEMKEAVHNRE